MTSNAQNETIQAEPSFINIEQSGTLLSAANWHILSVEYELCKANRPPLGASLCKYMCTKTTASSSWADLAVYVPVYCEMRVDLHAEC